MRFTVDNRSRLSDREAFGRVVRVIDVGEVSKTKAGPQYCFVTVFNDGTQVGVVRRKQSQTFVVTDGP